VLAASDEQALELALARIDLDGVDATIESLDALAERDSAAPGLLAARARMRLLADDLEGARELLEGGGAGSPELVRERAALALALDKPGLALTLVTRDSTPRALYLRGLALHRLERPDRAAEVLEHARQLLPDSIPILLALAIARHHENPNTADEGLEHRFDELTETAPTLLSDGARVGGLHSATDAGHPEDRAICLAILEGASRLWSADLAVEGAHYRCEPGGPLRALLPRGERGPSAARALHADDPKIVGMVENALLRALGVSPPRPARAAEVEAEEIQESNEPWKPRYLSPEQVEAFLRDGYLVVRNAFDKETARRWRADANRRLRNEPEKWVKGYDPEDESRSLSGYDPDDPSTWTWGRVDLEGPEIVEIAEFAPDAWAAICDLLGGPERIRTTSWNNYLIINFNADAHLGVDRPAPNWDSWHIDDPQPVTRLDRIRNGLVCIIVVDDILPKSGNTWLALDSIPKVARELAASPSGVDFIADRGHGITEQCERFFEVTGETGDILMMHPLMMHSSSPNRSPRVRWMGNPMVYLDQPLDPWRPRDELSPVELAIRRAIDPQ
jgi:hypothetical protein